MFNYIEMFCSPKRKHVRNGMLSPVPRKRQKNVNRDCLEDAWLFRSRFVNQDHEYQKVGDLTALIGKWQVDLVEFAKIAVWSDILDWTPDRSACSNRFPELRHQRSVGFDMWLRAQKQAGIVFEEYRLDILTYHAILEILSAIDHAQQDHVGQKPGYMHWIEIRSQRRGSTLAKTFPIQQTLLDNIVHSDQFFRSIEHRDQSFVSVFLQSYPTLAI